MKLKDLTDEQLHHMVEIVENVLSYDSGADLEGGHMSGDEVVARIREHLTNNTASACDRKGYYIVEPREWK